MPAPALSGLAAAARQPPAPLRSRPDPRAGGGGRTGLPPPVGQRAPVGPPAPRLPGAVLLPGHQLPAHWALSHGPPWLLLSPLPAGPGEQPRGLAGLRAPRLRRGDSPARPRRNEAGRDRLGDPAACWAPPAPKCGYRMLRIWACLKKCRLVKCQKRPAFHGGLTETKEEAEVHVWPCNKTDCTCESSEGEELLPVMPGFFEVIVGLLQ
ncbi:collagen alpha-1(I) chain-like [Pyrgilauda ruficollis]|uniref:collagen alpha-1(I) chain-like n=1 Tax=Pyrgilauda ruficollis TaxID=221976 RepID=UPI001B86089C|nr:collagen alpha-1(I) chain-like [Pyrgilauda ruficollis]